MNEKEAADFFRTVFDTMPSLVFVVDQHMRIEDYNATVAELLTAGGVTIIKQRTGAILHCLHSLEVTDGCGKAPFCKNCIIKDSVADAFRGNHVVRRRTKIELVREGNKADFYALITATPFSFQDRALALLVIEDLTAIADLSSMIPICSLCKKIRDERKTWIRIEAYFNSNLGLDFTHSLCPDCYRIEMEKLKELIRVKQESGSSFSEK